MSAISSPNIAIIKYWGKQDEEINNPLNKSLSFKLSPKVFSSETTVHESDTDCIEINGKPFPLNKRTALLISAFRKAAARAKGAPVVTNIRIETRNSFPMSCGLASSAAGAAALVLALNMFFGTSFSVPVLSALARYCSGSGGRSIFSGAALMTNIHATPASRDLDPNMLEWYAEPVAVHSSIRSNLTCVVVILSDVKKPMPSTEAMGRCVGTAEMNNRLTKMDTRIETAVAALKSGDFDSLARVSEEDWRCMHAVVESALTFSYLNERSWKVADLVKTLRETSGLPVFVTFDAGPNPVIFLYRDCADRVIQAVRELVPDVCNIIHSDLEW